LSPVCKSLGFSLFLWGSIATTIPLIWECSCEVHFRFDDAILLGVVSGSRTTTASSHGQRSREKSQIPGLGYTVTYAVATRY